MGNTIFDRAKVQLENLKILSEELQLQMALGKAEARDMLEKERKAISSYFSQQKKVLAKANQDSKGSRRDFLSCVEDLEASLHGEVPVDSAQYEKYKTNVLHNIYRLEEEVRQNYPLMNIAIQDSLDGFKAKMDAFRVNLALHDIDDPERVKKIKLEFSDKLDEVRKLLANRENQEAKVDNFIEDITTSYDHLRQAISELSK